MARSRWVSRQGIVFDKPKAPTTNEWKCWKCQHWHHEHKESDFYRWFHASARRKNETGCAVEGCDCPKVV